MPPETPGPRRKILSAAADEVARIDGERPDALTVDIDGRRRTRHTMIHLETEEGEIAALLGWVPKLDEDELAILRALAGATESLMARGIARALAIDEDSSTLRTLLSPEAPLRAEGYMSHVRGEGYSITSKGRQALEAAGDP